jgi:hypothetical protein
LAGGVVAAKPRTRDDALVMGRVTFDADGVTFTGGKGATRAYGQLHRRWEYADLYAQRLRGWGGQARLMLVPTDERRPPIDLWIWGSKTLALDTSKS